ncbi:hypothetical protein Y032_0006g3029 [Ancylostoma ceylanicum]|uniref:Uncharacterized protein n=1 Tax=Ancylostoma ceylanicum TaxID=53326 RepID=A0A016VQI7_9BILA|nr:hypothetical protein Y032_0006g3029 [Ancylostoma ceylanicum]
MLKNDSVKAQSRRKNTASVEWNIAVFRLFYPIEEESGVPHGRFTGQFILLAFVRQEQHYEMEHEPRQTPNFLHCSRVSQGSSDSLCNKH